MGDFISFRWWHPGGEKKRAEAIIILCSILEMRPKEFRGLSNCEMSRDTSSLFPRTKNLLVLSMKIFAISVHLQKLIPPPISRQYSSFSIGHRSIGQFWSASPYFPFNSYRRFPEISIGFQFFEFLEIFNVWCNFILPVKFYFYHSDSRILSRWFY